ncbi:probable E3 ubiquitin-protein ligase RHY1A [Andrographis paniculata]|uniref:probable E3 ubiquitin-protein ligase RHY1A n=1 Tax=Andrographis paniculata TaxID=175694 RepID=UPI0021E757A3|nr:probable E3 ubiquitin-protein ligase RHY1A [Andrographis paniculata]
MTSASELFYNRRFRFGRNSDAIGVGIDSDPPSSVDRSSRRHRHYHTSGSNQTRRDRVCDPLRRAPQASVSRRNSNSSQERESTRPEGGIHPFSSGNSSHSGRDTNPQGNLRNNRNDRLPGAVLLARERLLERLRGTTLSATRRSDRHISVNNVHNIDIIMEDDFRDTNLIGRQWKRRPPGLSQEAISSLQVELFCPAEEKDAAGLASVREISECSICLESFSPGDELVRLPCRHRYHLCCLYPWLQTCGDCPYCRRSIDVSTG